MSKPDLVHPTRALTPSLWCLVEKSRCRRQLRASRGSRQDRELPGRTAVRSEGTVAWCSSPSARKGAVSHAARTQGGTCSSRPPGATGDRASGATGSRRGHGDAATAVRHRASLVCVTFTRCPKLSLEFDARRPKASCRKDHCYSTSLKPVERFTTEIFQKDGILAFEQFNLEVDPEPSKWIKSLTRVERNWQNPLVTKRQSLAGS